MLYRFNFTTDDYIESNALQKANSRENRGVYHLVLFLGLGCIAYLNTAILRSALTYNDAFSYGVGIIAAILFLIQYSPKIVPSILIPIRLKYGSLPRGLLGTRAFETTDDRLVFSSSVARISFGYDALTRLNHSDKIALFYFENGTVHPVPLRVFGFLSYEKTEALEGIQAKAIEASKSGSRPGWEALDERNCFHCAVSEQDVLRANRYEQLISRRQKLKDPFALYTAAFILFCLFSGIYGLFHQGVLPEGMRGYLTFFLVLETIGSLIALILWFKPAFLSQYMLKQMLRTGQYTEGYIGKRTVSWNENELQVTYGTVGMAFPWGTFSVVDEGQELLFLQDTSLVFFLPKSGVSKRFLEKLTNYQKQEKE